MLKDYIMLTKPGILFGNAITTLAGFFLAIRSGYNPWLLFITLLGLSCIIASACIFNNYIDRDIDKKMQRTKKRGFVQGSVSIKKSLFLGVFLLLLGSFLLKAYTNTLSLFIALFGFFMYVVVYGFFKRRSIHGTLIGSIAGAVPPVVGYTAVTNHLDLGAFLLFLTVALWQMPHFFAIALYRLGDYTNAKLPVLPLEKGPDVTKRCIFFYIIAFIVTSSLLTFFQFTGHFFLIVTSLLGYIWLQISLASFKTENDAQSGRKIFLFSIIMITGLSAMIAFDTVP